MKRRLVKGLDLHEGGGMGFGKLDCAALTNRSSFFLIPLIARGGGDRALCALTLPFPSLTSLNSIDPEVSRGRGEEKRFRFETLARFAQWR